MSRPTSQANIRPHTSAGFSSSSGLKVKIYKLSQPKVFVRPKPSKTSNDEGWIREIVRETVATHSTNDFDPVIIKQGCVYQELLAPAVNAILSISNPSEASFSAASQKTPALSVAERDVTIALYGKSGSGKTYTLNGLLDEYCDNLLIPSNASNASQSRTFSIHLSVFEFEEQTVYDITATASGGERSSLSVQGSSSTGYRFSPKFYEIAPGPDQLAKIKNIRNRIEKGRKVAATGNNTKSSRVHTCFRLTVHEAVQMIASLEIFDLAGQESTAAGSAVSTTAEEKRRRGQETGAINESLYHFQKLIRDLGNGGWKTSCSLTALNKVFLNRVKMPHTVQFVCTVTDEDIVAAQKTLQFAKEMFEIGKGTMEQTMIPESLITRPLSALSNSNIISDGKSSRVQAAGKARSALKEQNKTILAGTDRLIAARDQAITDRDIAIAARDRYLVERDQAFAERDQAVAEKNHAAATLRQEMFVKDREIASGKCEIELVTEELNIAMRKLGKAVDTMTQDKNRFFGISSSASTDGITSSERIEIEESANGGETGVSFDRNNRKRSRT
ncbi:uncharacterized protein IL334_007969 [Kwoniella shivajii]|uniref:Kinesin motor domain-containing protein n=1 Tax=Kwoniella shivajii TaxID=564305 RepID=A0ABZ1DC98_9TREE|nr:hypothetical protein IL334_007969 [Kwoniella shivajii]